jgi:glycosyltransferase involved in cell wall biosynthesis
MKIFLITTFFHPVTGGVESHVYDLAKQLQKYGHEVEVLCSDSTKIGPRLREKKSTISGIRVHRFRTLFSLSYYHKFYPWLFVYLMTHNFDVLHVHGFRNVATYIALFAAFIKRKKVVLTSHNPFPTNSRSAALNLLIKFHDLTVGKLFTKRLHRIIILVDSEKEIFIKKFGVKKEQLVVIPGSIADKFYEQGDKEQFYKDWDIEPTKWKGIVVSAARMNFTKGYQNLHKAVKKLPKVLFYFAGGDDGYLDKLKVLYADCPNVIFSEHFLPADKLINMYAGGDIFVFPSLHEAFGMVLLESLAQGLPVISTNVGGPQDIVKDDFGILQNPTDQDLWFTNIKKLVDDPELRQQMSINAKSYSSKYTWDKQIVKIIKTYK